MSVARILNKETIQLNNECSLVIEGKQEDGYEHADPSIKVLFDIENKQPVEASDEELMDMYVECFKGVSRKRAR